MLLVLQFTSEKHREARTGGVISDWYRKELSVRARVKFDALLRGLSKTRATNWSPTDYKPLTTPHAGISELRFKDGGIEYRPLCFLLPPAEVGGAELDVMVLLIGAYKKMNKWTPFDARDTALARKKLVLSDRRLLHDYTF
jgi:hypothetical protein